MKKSIRWQIAGIFIGLVGTILLVSILINSWFLESFYIRNKQEALVSMYNQMNIAVQTGSLTSEGVVNKLSEQVEVDNISFIVITGNNQKILTATQNEMKTQELMAQLMGYLFNKNQGNGELLKENKKYQIRSAKDMFGSGEYIEMWGYLDNGNAFLLRSPLESIRESADLSNSYVIEIYDINEEPPKVSLLVKTKENGVITSETVEFDITNRIDAILETVN